MSRSPFIMKFDPKTIKHLGVRMYSTLPPAVAEIVANAYDADASEVQVMLFESNGKPTKIEVKDNGHGLTRRAINHKFLIIGRNRRDDDGDEPSPKYGRKPIGKKGLGKLALFGLATRITITTCHSGKKNIFVLDWEKLNEAKGSYRPTAVVVDQATDEGDGTVISLTGLKRKTSFDAESLANSLARMFIVDSTFALSVQTPAGDRIAVTNERRYNSINVEFEWDISKPLFVPAGSDYEGKIIGKLMTAQTPIPPASGLRGITLFSRQKLVNAPEFFSSSTSSHFYQYLTGWLSVDFIDDLDDDVIATNRQSLDWDHPEMARLREFLAGVVSQVNSAWRAKRKDGKKIKLKQTTGIDVDQWVATMSDEVRDKTEQILASLGGEDALETYTPVVKALHDLIPEYPLLHWRHLHKDVRDRIGHYYENSQFGDAASEGVKIYCEILRSRTGSTLDGTDLISEVFNDYGGKTSPMVQLNQLLTESEKSIQKGQQDMSRGIISGFRNPISHAPIDSSVPSVFSEVDCLNILSLASYLVTRLDGATINRKQP